jgi:CRP-like cAMP-binding protein
VEPEFVRRLGEAGRTVLLARGETLYREGEPAVDLVVVGQGAVTLTMRTGPDLDVPIAVLGPASVFGSTALLGGAVLLQVPFWGRGVREVLAASAARRAAAAGAVAAEPRA